MKGSSAHEGKVEGWSAASTTVPTTLREPGAELYRRQLAAWSIELVDFDDASAVRLLKFPCALNDTVRECEDGLRVRRLVAFQDDRLTAIAALADVGIEFDRARGTAR